ncbi:MAG: ribulose-phosphate 3-epimerase [Chlamydiae bacterium]|nr:ribulose-phosphate 3-epimerase [Chlamydiota bacterium]MBI3277062.1 ribulose-phosphate 3-epimerase [Chlamydiota bacterium]
MKRTIKIAPSILAGDFGNLEREAHKAEEALADILHVDIMDGHFVPNLTIGPQAVHAIKKSTSLPLDVHLMISDPLKYADEFIDAGATNLTFHLEINQDVDSVIEKIKRRGIDCGIALKPGTPFEKVVPFLKRIDLLLLMTVEPGFGGQKFMSGVLSKVSQARQWMDRENLSVDIEVDGGISSKTVAEVVQSGANVLVAGSAIYEASDAGVAVKELRELAYKSSKFKVKSLKEIKKLKENKCRNG